jgi:hypothetical protein
VGGRSFGFSGTDAFDFAGAASLRLSKPAGLDAASLKPLRRSPTSLAAPTLQKLLAYAHKTCTELGRRNWYKSGTISASLDQFGLVEQLFSTRIRPAFKRKPKYETVHRIVYPESLPAADSQGVSCRPVPRRGTAPIFIFSLRGLAKPNR